MDIIRDNVCKEDVHKISSIPLSTRKPPDRRIWKPTKNGEFSVKTVYHLAVSTSSHLLPQRASTSYQIKEWQNLSKINGMPRVKSLCWRACLQSLPTKDNLMKRRIIEDPICDLCGGEIESIDHLLIKCSVVAKFGIGAPSALISKKLPSLPLRSSFRVIWIRQTMISLNSWLPIQLLKSGMEENVWFFTEEESSWKR